MRTGRGKNKEYIPPRGPDRGPGRGPGRGRGIRLQELVAAMRQAALEAKVVLEALV